MLLKESPIHGDDAERNIIHFEYKVYKYDHLFKTNQVLRPLPLESPIKTLKDLEYNYVRVTYCDEYKDVGKY